MTGISHAIGGADALAAEVRRDLDRLNYPGKTWTIPMRGPDGRDAVDVLIVGAGMYGQAVAFALLREGVTSLRIIDACERGDEGPWGTFARMETLRSPKHQNGPDLGVPSLTFRAWFEARRGEAAWKSLYKIHRLEWRDYLLWVRSVLALPVENRVALTSLSAAGPLLRADVAGPDGPETAYSRRVVLATGREGAGGRHVPSFPSLSPDSEDWGRTIFHSSEDVDFSRLKGARVGILGANASAFDNAGVALEAGAGSVTMSCRRPFLPQVNKSRWMGFAGFQRGFPALDDAARWRLAVHVAGEQMPPPHESVLRCLKHPNFDIRFNEPWLDVVPENDGATVETPTGARRYDVAVLATGFAADLRQRPELRQFASQIRVWADVVGDEAAARTPQLARFPYLGQAFELVERTPGSCPALAQIHVVNYAAAVSWGALAGDIPGIAPASATIAHAISASLFREDFEGFFQQMEAFDEPELSPTPLFVPRDRRFRDDAPAGVRAVRR